MDEAARNDSSSGDVDPSAGRPVDDDAHDLPDDGGPLYCRVCGYRVDSLGHSICPECGTEFDINDPYSVETSPPGTARPTFHSAVKWVFRAVTLIILIGFAIVLVMVIAMIISEIVA